MSAKRRWNKEGLVQAVQESESVRQVILKLGLIPAGGNYVQVQNTIREYNLSTQHFKGRGWNKGLVGIGKQKYSLKEILVTNSSYQSHKLKKRLFLEKLKEPKCEKCGWAEWSKDGRLPLELDHINGDKRDNRLCNVRILCPNCHSLELTHRGRNIKRK